MGKMFKKKVKKQPLKYHHGLKSNRFGRVFYKNGLVKSTSL
jgi:hypothetical protein